MELLARVPNVELWKVYGNTDVRIAEGEWTIQASGNSVISQVGGVKWNLAGACLKPSATSYVFALNAQQQLFYCVNVPPGVSQEEISVVEAILGNFCQFKDSHAHEQQAVSDRSEQQVAGSRTKTDMVVEGLGKATVAAVRGLQVSSTYLSKKIRQGGDKVKDNTKECVDPKPVSDATRKRVKHIKTLSKTVSTVAHAAIDAVATITSQVAEVVVDQVSSKKDGDKPPGKTTVAAKRVGASVLVAAAEVWEAMEEAFVLVAKTSAVTTADLVSHKYGEEMGNVTYDGMSAAGHVADSAYIARRLGAKAVLKSTAKKTAAGFVTNGQSEADKQAVSIEGRKQPLYPAVEKPAPI
ncbi:hypothetical protein BSKO_10880 [Bryopsis sp. KO-2023]|nr:hypothetical protein BSKO_10880 [Bryopsis sp. KO-2023]